MSLSQVLSKAGVTGSPRNSHPPLTVSDLARIGEDWLQDGELRGHTQSTLKNRRGILTRLLWWLGEKGHDVCTTAEVRGFLSYLLETPEEGRFGNTQARTKASASTVATYHRHLQAFFRWAVDQEILQSDPMRKIKPPLVREGQIQPLGEAQVQSLLSAARRGKYPRRDVAILMLLLDTGLRAGELCRMRTDELDLIGRRATVLGKGNKVRSVYFGQEAGRAVRAYLRDEKRDPEDVVFRTEDGEPFCPNTLLQLVNRLGEAARISGVRCSPHTLRHTFAVSFLRAGGNVFSLQQMLGHTSLTMTRRYVSLAEADIEKQAKTFSPMDRLNGSKRR